MERIILNQFPSESDSPSSLSRIYIINSLSTHISSSATTMAFSSASCFFTSPNFTINQHPSSSTSVRYAKSPISADFNAARSTRFQTHSSLYEVLGIQIGADTEEIKAAYRRLARVLHPDVGNLDSSPDEFIKLQSAYATLSDPGKRADYDRSLFVRENVASRSSSPAGYGGRRWETDQCW
ncbi:hypothetical protein R6Q57_019714 [Mikania cordata]